MPSAAEQLSQVEQKLESTNLNEQRTSENAQKENDSTNGEKSLSGLQQVIGQIQNKIRNLEKRKNKLDGYIQDEEDGKKLSSEQRKAMEKYDEVSAQLQLSKEFCKQFMPIQIASSKKEKSDARKALFIRQVQETSKVREVIMIQDILRQLKNERTRLDFLRGENKACLVTDLEMSVLEQFSKLTKPVHPQFSNEPSFNNSAKSASDHLSFVVDGRTRQFMETGFSYDKIKELFQRIQTCGYFEKDIQIVEQERPMESETPQTDDLDIKDDNNVVVMQHIQQQQQQQPAAVVSTHLPSAPLPTQVPNPTQLFVNGGSNAPSHPQQQQQVPVVPSQQQQQMQVISQHQQQQPNVQNMQTTVTAVENAFFNQIKYSQTQGPNDLMVQQQQQQQPNRYVEDFATANISFLQDSIVDQQQQQQQQQQASNLGNQSKKNPSSIQQQQQQQPQTFTNQNYHPQATHQHQHHHFPPPGLKLNNNANNAAGAASNIPVNYTQTSTQQTQQSSTVPPYAHNKHHQQQQNSYQHQQQQQQQQYQMPTNIQNLKDVEQKLNHVVQQNNNNNSAGDVLRDESNGTPPDQRNHSHKMHHHHHVDKDTNRTNTTTANDYQQQPQIDTWNNDTGNSQTANSNYSRFNRGNRNSSGGGGGGKYNNYRSSQQTRNENGGSDSNNRESGGGSTTYFRNNERYNSGNRYNNNSNNNNNGNNMNDRPYKQRDNNYRAGSGRFNSMNSGQSAQTAGGGHQRK